MGFSFINHPFWGTLKSTLQFIDDGLRLDPLPSGCLAQRLQSLSCARRVAGFSPRDDPHQAHQLRNLPWRSFSARSPDRFPSEVFPFPGGSGNGASPLSPLFQYKKNRKIHDSDDDWYDVPDFFFNSWCHNWIYHQVNRSPKLRLAKHWVVFRCPKMQHVRSSRN